METVEQGGAIMVRPKLHKALGVLEDKLKAMKTLTQSSYQTNGEFRFNPAYTGNSPIKIHNEQNIQTLLEIHAYLRTKNEDYVKSATDLGLDSYPAFVWQSYSWKQWEHDLKIRIALVSNHEQNKKLVEAKKKLEQFLTVDDQLAIALKELGLDSAE